MAAPGGPEAAAPLITIDEARLLHAAGRLEDAADCCAAILQTQPDHFDALHLLGVVRFQQRRYDEGLRSVLAALQLRPDDGEAWSNLGRALTAVDRLDKALASCTKAVSLRPDFAEAWHNRGITLHTMGRVRDAVASFDRAVAIRPDYHEAFHCRGMAKLALGDLNAGWRDYEHRWARKDIEKHRSTLPYPVWTGQSLQHKSLLVYEEQGLGDVIQFARYLALVMDETANLTFVVRRPLHRLLHGIGVKARIVEKLEPRDTFDFQAALLSLPLALGTTLETIPAAVPYLHAEPALVEQWRARIDDYGFRVGICWQGNPLRQVDVGRSAPLHLFAPLAAIPGVRLISLQKNHGLDQLAALPDGMRVETLGTILDAGPDAFVDTAAVIANLDLVITPDTSIAHLAGALGRSVWIALKQVPDWRWMLDREDSPWYPTARLFRQERHRDWDGVFARLAAALAERVGERSPDTPLSQQPGRLDAMRQAFRLHAAGNLEEAASQCASILVAQPEHFDALHLLAVIRFQQARHEEGITSIRAALRLQPENAQAWSNLGRALTALGRLDEALEACDRSLALQPEHVEALNNRGLVLQALRRPAEAEASFDRALAIRPDYADALNNRGSALLERKHLQAALESFERALATRPDYIEALNNRGVVLRLLGRPAEAVASFDKALAVRPGSAEALNGRGTALRHLGRITEALKSYDQALKIRPNYAEALVSRGLTLLMAGDLQRGWKDYEHRWEVNAAPKKRLDAPYPVWAGEALRGRSIIVYEEQGLGDTIQFVRFLPLLVAMGADVTFLVRPSLHRLLRRRAGAVRLIAEPPAGETFDFQIALLSLPRALGTTLDTIPDAVPYLVAEAPLAARWRERLGERGFKVGICWQGNPVGQVDLGRSPPLRSFGALAAVPDVRLISLQKVHGLGQLASLPPGMAVESFGDDLDRGPDAFVDTAAVIANLDLVITSDTSVAHLAGALGCPVWLALPQTADWRWLRERDDSLWYPTARLFRQQRPGDWDELFDRMAAALRQQLAERPNAGPADKSVPGGGVHAAPAAPRQYGSAHAETVLKDCRYGRMLFLPEVGDVGRSLAAYGEFGEAEAEVFAQLLRPGDIVIEIGAGIGAQTIFLAKLVGRDGAVLAFEARRIPHQLLCANVALNEVFQVQTFHAFAGNAGGRRTASPARDCAGQDRHGVPRAAPLNDQDVPLWRLDDLALPALRMVKITAGGFDSLAGARGLIAKFRPILYMSNACHAVSGQLIAQIDELGYDLWWHLPKLFNRNNFAKNPRNIFGERVSPSLLCFAKEARSNISGLRKVSGSEDWWDAGSG